MRQAAFIASLVAPDVASVGAKAAIQFMRGNKNFKNPLIKQTKEWQIGESCFTKHGAGTHFFFPVFSFPFLFSSALQFGSSLNLSYTGNLFQSSALSITLL